MDDKNNDIEPDDVSLDDDETAVASSDSDDISNAINDTIRPILDGTTYGGVKQSDKIRTWELQGLTKNGSESKAYSALHLSKNPPRLVFKSFSDPYTEEYAVYLDKYTAQQLYDALSNVVRAYKSMPINEKKEKWSFMNMKKKLRDSFEDDPIKFTLKVIGMIVVLALIIIPLF